jgi:formylglycine-generating enzyme required for sulfatase activity
VLARVSLDDLSHDASPDVASDGGSDVVTSDVAVDAPIEAGACGALHGPKMIVVPSLNPAGNYCIDSTEVTEAQYQEFLNANVATSTQPSFCSANTSFYPDLAQPGCSTHPFDPVKSGALPVGCVDWCDAYAFCRWAGKRMCGEISHDGGAIAPALINTAANDQWFSACSAEAARTYPYGNAYDASVCNGKDLSNGNLVDAGSLAKCVGGYAGIFDMSGNVAEWEDACGDAATDGAVSCMARGGSVTELPGNLVCMQAQTLDRATASYNYGIRCCADL